MLVLACFAAVADTGCVRDQDRRPGLNAAAIPERPEARRLQNTGKAVPGQLMVRFKDPITSQRAEAIIAGFGAQVLTRYADQQLFHIALPAGTTVQVGLIRFQALDEVEFAEPNQRYTTED